MIIRLANAYRGLAPLPGYNHHIIVSVHLRNPRPNGFPSSEEGDDLTSLELSLCGALEVGNDSLCVLVVTNNGLRDFIFYTRNVQAAKEKLENGVSMFAGFVIEFAIEPEENWDIYQTFCRMLEPDAKSRGKT